MPERPRDGVMVVDRAPRNIGSGSAAAGGLNGSTTSINIASSVSLVNRTGRIRKDSDGSCPNALSDDVPAVGVGRLTRGVTRFWTGRLVELKSGDVVKAGGKNTRTFLSPKGTTTTTILGGKTGKTGAGPVAPVDPWPVFPPVEVTSLGENVTESLADTRI